MNIGIFQKKEMLTTRTLREAAEKRGHKVYSIHGLHLEPNNLDLAKIPKNLDILYYWYGAGTVGRVCFCEHLDKNGVRVVNAGIFKEPFFVNKIYQLYKIGINNILAPRTITQFNTTYDEIFSRLGSPFILKGALGCCGKKVYLIKNEAEFETAKLELKGNELLYQEFIPNDGDYRIHVIGNKAVCVYKRVPNGEDFRANVSRGGSMEKVEDKALVSELFKIAEKVSNSFDGAEIIGVDLIKNSKTGEILFIESNESPGIKKVHEVTGVDIADKMVDYFESR